MPTLFDPRFDLSQIPPRTSWCQIDAPWKLTAPLHFIDRRVGKWHHEPQLMPPHDPFEV